MCVGLCVCPSESARRRQKRRQVDLELQLVVNHTVCLLGTELGSPRAVCSLTTGQSLLSSLFYADIIFHFSSFCLFSFIVKCGPIHDKRITK